jgi:OPT family oligopeptide transporter
MEETANTAVPFLGDMPDGGDFSHLDPQQPENVDMLTAGMNAMAAGEARGGAASLSVSSQMGSAREQAESLKSLKGAQDRFGQASRAASQAASQHGHSDDDLPEVTTRGMIVATLVGGIVGAQNIYFSWKLGWTMGVSLTSSILGYALLSTLQNALINSSIAVIRDSMAVPFGVKENCCMQTAASAAASMSSASGLAVGLFALTPGLQRYYDFCDEDPAVVGTTLCLPDPDPANPNGFIECCDPGKTFEMNWQQQVLWCYGILMFGFFVAIPLRKPLIEDYQLIFPSGTATAYVMTAVHASSEGSKEGLRQFWLLAKVFIPCQLWYIIKSFLFVGLDAIPIFGMRAAQYDWVFDGSTAFYATGIMIPPKFSASWFLGSIVGWIILVPMLDQKPYRGEWYDEDEGLKSLKGPFGYVLFPSIAIMLVDSFFELGKLGFKVYADYKKNKAQGVGGREGSQGSGYADLVEEGDAVSAAEAEGADGVVLGASALAPTVGPSGPKRDDEISPYIWVTGMIVFMCTGVLAGTLIFPKTEWYSLAVASMLGPMAAPGILYGVGITDIGMQTVFAKLAQIMLCLWSPGSYTGPMVAGCLVFTCLSQAGDLIQDFKTGYLVGATPNAMLKAQIIGAMSAPWWAVGAYFVYTSGGAVPSQALPAIAASVWLGFVQTFQEGIGAMPKHAAWFVLVAALLTLTTKIAEVVLPPEKVKYLPSLMPFSIGFYSFPNYGLDALIGGVIRQIWIYRDAKGFEKNYAVVAAGMVAGEGITSLLIALVKAFSGQEGWLQATWGTYGS